MRRFTSFVAVFLLLMAAAPVLACVTKSTMSHEESACCRAMHGECGGMAKMGCCRTDFRSDAHPQQAATAPQVRLVQVFVEWAAQAYAAAPVILAGLHRSPDEHSPPGLLIARLTVLRI